MVKRITDEQIALAKQYFNSGFSLPEIALMTKMSLASCKKYLAKEIRLYISQSAKQSEHKPTELSSTQFETYVEFEFAQISDRIALKDLYYQLQEQYKNDANQLISLREAYDNRLSKLAEPTANSNNVLIKQLAKQLGIKIAVHKGGKYGDTNEFSSERLLGHIVWWLEYASKRGKLNMPIEEALQIVQNRFAEHE